MRTYNSHRVVVETQADTINIADQIRRIEIDLTINLRTAHIALDCQLTFSIALQAKEFARYETVENIQWEALHGKLTIHASPTLAIIGSAEQADLLVVLHNASLDSMGVVTFLQIDQFSTKVSQMTTLVDHIMHGHITGHREMSFSILHHMEVTIEQAAHAWQVIGEDRCQLTQIQTIDTYRQILQIVRAIVF